MTWRGSKSETPSSFVSSLSLPSSLSSFPPSSPLLKHVHQTLLIRSRSLAVAARDSADRTAAEKKEEQKDATPKRPKVALFSTIDLSARQHTERTVGTPTRTRTHTYTHRAAHCQAIQRRKKGGRPLVPEAPFCAVCRQTEQRGRAQCYTIRLARGRAEEGGRGGEKRKKRGRKRRRDEGKTAMSPSILFYFKKVFRPLYVQKRKGRKRRRRWEEERGRERKDRRKKERGERGKEKKSDCNVPPLTFADELWVDIARADFKGAPRDAHDVGVASRGHCLRRDTDRGERRERKR